MAIQPSSGGSVVSLWLQRLVKVEPQEIRALLWAFSYFFALLCAYYIVRPMRDAMGIAGGVDKLQWLFTATFLVMLAAVPLYGLAVSRMPRRRLLPFVYGFFIINLLMFFALFRAVPDPRCSPVCSLYGSASTTCLSCRCSGASWRTCSRSRAPERLFP